MLRSAESHLDESVSDDSSLSTTDSSSRYLLVSVIEARGLRGINSEGTSRPYAVVQYGQQEKKTTTVEDTVSPHWNAHFLYSVEHNEQESVQEAASLGDLSFDAPPPPPPLSTRQMSVSAGGERQLLIMLFSLETMMSDTLLGKIEVDLTNVSMNKPVALNRWYKVEAADRKEQDRLKFRRQSHLRKMSRVFNPVAYLKENMLGGQGEVRLSIVPLDLAAVPGLLDSRDRKAKHLQLYMEALQQLVSEMERALETSTSDDGPPADSESTRSHARFLSTAIASQIAAERQNSLTGLGLEGTGAGGPILSPRGSSARSSSLRDLDLENEQNSLRQAQSMMRDLVARISHVQRRSSQHLPEDEDEAEIGRNGVVVAAGVDRPVSARLSTSSSSGASRKTRRVSYWDDGGDGEGKMSWVSKLCCCLSSPTEALFTLRLCQVGLGLGLFALLWSSCPPLSLFGSSHDSSWDLCDLWYGDVSNSNGGGGGGNGDTCTVQDCSMVHGEFAAWPVVLLAYGWLLVGLHGMVDAVWLLGHTALEQGWGRRGRRKAVVEIGGLTVMAVTALAGIAILSVTKTVSLDVTGGTTTGPPPSSSTPLFGVHVDMTLLTFLTSFLGCVSPAYEEMDFALDISIGFAIALLGLAAIFHSSFVSGGEKAGSPRLHGAEDEDRTPLQSDISNGSRGSYGSAGTSENTEATTAAPAVVTAPLVPRRNQQ